MNARMMVPLIDLVFLTLGSVLVAMTQMERVEAIAVDVARVGRGAANVRRGELNVLSVTPGGVRLGQRVLSPAELPAAVAGKRVVIRADRSMPTQRTLAVLAEVLDAGADASIEVRQTGSPSGGRGSR
jgi:biopolymer transport protein ExbD